jgi:hypothetical protein
MIEHEGDNILGNFIQHNHFNLYEHTGILNNFRHESAGQ